MSDLEQDADGQDLAEVFDETNTTRDGYDIAHPDTDPGVYDVTAAEDDADEDEPADLEPLNFDEIDEADREVMLEEDDGVDSDHPGVPDQADRVAEDDGMPADFEADDRPSPRRRSANEKLDADLEESFPASDPLPVDPGAD